VAPAGYRPMEFQLATDRLTLRLMGAEDAPWNLELLAEDRARPTRAGRGQPTMFLLSSGDPAADRRADLGWRQ
jgi:hypothetical protein